MKTDEEKKVQNQEEEILNPQEAEVVEGGVNGPKSLEEAKVEDDNNTGKCTTNLGIC